MPSVVEFAGGNKGQWRVTRIEPCSGATLPVVGRVSVGLVGQNLTSAHAHPNDTAWSLRGAISNLRYTTRVEADNLRSLQASLDRPTATCALIPIKQLHRVRHFDGTASITRPGKQTAFADRLAFEL